MKITEVSFFRLEMPLEVPYTIAYETVSHASNIILEIKADNGMTGYGCSAPDKILTGETPEQVESNIESVLKPLLLGQHAFRLAYYNRELKKTLPGQSSTRAMLDMAIHDLMARKAGIPLYMLLGGFRHSIPTSITIGILPLDETLEMAKKYLADGFFILKLKGGLNKDEDIEKIHKLRENFGRELKIRFDANQGYTPAQAIEFIERTKAAQIEIFEQPTASDADDQLGEVTRNVSIPVMADESIRSLKDAFRLTQKELIDMVNIKLMKMGGIMDGQHINSLAKSGGMEVMVGCYDECGLGISAGLHFALSRPNIEFADLDGHLDLKNDPFRNLFTIKDGILYPGNDAGLGNVARLL